MTTLIWGICFTIIIVFIIIKAVSVLRTYLQAKNYGILKAHLLPGAMVTTLCIVLILIVAFFCTIAEGNKAKRELAEWEQRNSGSYSELYTDNDSFSNKYIWESMKKAHRSTYLSVAIPLVVVYYIFAGLQRTLYITEEGLFARKLDAPADITALRRGDKIDIYLKADTAHFKVLFSLDSTPKNLAALGRFIEWND